MSTEAVSPETTPSEPSTEPPATMLAATHTAYGGPEVIEVGNQPVPEPPAGRVLVRVHAASLNPYDMHMLTGTPWVARLSAGLRKPKDGKIGVDLAGTVVALGEDVEGIEVGDEVFGVAPGSVAEYAAARATLIAPKPSHVTFAEGAAIGLASSTAIQALRDKGALKAGDRVLINGASGGIGTQAVHLAKALGAHVTGVASERNEQLVRSLGVDEFISYTTSDFTETGPYDLILDTIGHRKLRDIRRALAEGGRYVTVGAPKHQKIRILLYPLKVLLAGKAWRREMKVLLATYKQEDFELFAQLLESGELKPVIDRRFPLDRTADAMQYIMDGHAQGKTIITVIPEESR